MNKHNKNELIQSLIVGLFILGFFLITNFTGMAPLEIGEENGFETQAITGLTLQSPTNNTMNETFNMQFAYQVTSDVNVINCSLLFEKDTGWEVNVSNKSAITEGQTEYFAVNLSYPEENINWTVQCEDSGGAFANNSEGKYNWTSSFYVCNGANIPTWGGTVTLTKDLDCTASTANYIYSINGDNTVIDCQNNELRNDDAVVIKIDSGHVGYNNIQIKNCNMSTKDISNPDGIGIDCYGTGCGLRDSIIDNNKFDYKEYGIWDQEQGWWEGVNVTNNDFKNDTVAGIAIYPIASKIGSPNHITGNNFTNTPTSSSAGSKSSITNSAVHIDNSGSPFYFDNNEFGNNPASTAVITTTINVTGLHINGTNKFTETRNALLLINCENCNIYNLNLTNSQITGSAASYGIHAAVSNTNITNVTARFRDYGIIVDSTWGARKFYGNNISNNDFRNATTAAISVWASSTIPGTTIIRNNNLSNSKRAFVSDRTNDGATVQLKDNDLSRSGLNAIMIYYSDNLIIQGDNKLYENENLKHTIYAYGAGSTQKTRNISINNLTIKGNGTGYGIYMTQYVETSNITNVNITKKDYGIYGEEIFEMNISYNEITHTNFSITIEDRSGGVNSDNISIYYNNLSNSTYGIKLNVDNATVKYNNITNASAYGIYLEGGTNITVGFNYFKNNYNTTIYITGGDYHTLKNINTSGNGSGYGFDIKTDKILLTNNTIWNKSRAIYLSSTNANIINITNSTFEYNKIYAIHSLGNDTYVYNSNFINDGNTSIFLETGSNNTIQNINITGNTTGYGIDIRQNNNTILYSYIYNKSYGIYLSTTNADFTNITNITLRYNKLYGIHSLGDNTTFYDLDLFDDGNASIYLASGMQNIIKNLNITGNNSGHGIDIKSDHNWVINTTIYNKSYGIYLSNANSDYNNITNNTFRYNNGSLYFSDGAGGTANLIWNNSFLETRTGNNLSEAEAEGNLFNTSYIGNYWFDIATLVIYDSDGDCLGDTGSDYPYNQSNNANVSGYITDHLPITCETEPPDLPDDWPPSTPKPPKPPEEPAPPPEEAPAPPSAPKIEQAADCESFLQLTKEEKELFTKLFGKLPCYFEVKEKPNISLSYWCNGLEINIDDAAWIRTAIKFNKPEFFIDLDSKEEKYCLWCYDGLKDYDEIGIDCGGPSCPKCEEKPVEFYQCKQIPTELIIALVIVIVGLLISIKLTKPKVKPYIKISAYTLSLVTTSISLFYVSKLCLDTYVIFLTIFGILSALYLVYIIYTYHKEIVPFKFKEKYRIKTKLKKTPSTLNQKIIFYNLSKRALKNIKNKKSVKDYKELLKIYKYIKVSYTEKYQLYLTLYDLYNRILLEKLRKDSEKPTILHRLKILRKLIPRIIKHKEKPEKQPSILTKEIKKLERRLAKPIKVHQLRKVKPITPHIPKLKIKPLKQLAVTDDKILQLQKLAQKQIKKGKTTLKLEEIEIKPQYRKTSPTKKQLQQKLELEKLDYFLELYEKPIKRKLNLEEIKVPKVKSRPKPESKPPSKLTLELDNLKRKILKRKRK